METQIPGVATAKNMSNDYGSYIHLKAQDKDNCKASLGFA